MTPSRRDLLVLGGLALAGSTLKTSPARAQSPKRGGTLTLRGWDPPMFDHMLQTAYRVQIPITLTHSRLVKHKAGAGVAPATFSIEGTSPSRGASRTRRPTSSSYAAAC